jgi:hypothetical protein
VVFWDGCWSAGCGVWSGVVVVGVVGVVVSGGGVFGVASAFAVFSGAGFGAGGVRTGSTGAAARTTGAAIGFGAGAAATSAGAAARCECAG